jgi:lipopolysaccharide biosynthesis glycosyltransferase
MPSPRQIVATVATGRFAEALDKTFTSFAQNKFLELHVFIIGERLPERQLPGITYHLFKPDPTFMDELREAYYRRLVFLDAIEAEFALLVDNSDVLCMQPLPELPKILRGAAFGAAVEHAGSRYLSGQGWTGCYLNAGVTFWNVPASKQMREEVVARGRTRFRSVEDQLTLNEVIQTRYYDQLIVLPSQYNFRAHYRFRQRGWPTVNSLDGVLIYHNSSCVGEAKKLIPVKSRASLPPLAPDEGPLTKWQKVVRKIQLRREPHIVR